MSEVADELGISERTARRDLAELQDAGIDIEIEKRANRVYASLTAERNYSPVSITKRERFTLLAIRRVFDVFKGTPFLDDVESVLNKLEQRMSEKERAEHAALGEQFIYMPDHGTKSYEGKEDVIDALQTGIILHRVVKYRYADARGRTRAGYLAAFRMAMYRHGLYAIGAQLKEPGDDVRGAQRGVFAVERFVEAEHLKAYEFQIPDDARLRDVLEGAFGPHLGDASGPHDIVVEFSPEKAPLVSSRQWHPSQRVTKQPNGSVRIAFSAPSLAPIVSWVLEWGPHAQAIAPTELVDQVTQELTQALKHYR